MCEGAQHVHVLALTLSPCVSLLFSFEVVKKKKIEFQMDRRSHIYSISSFQLFLEAIRGLHCVFMSAPWEYFRCSVDHFVHDSQKFQHDIIGSLCLESWGT